MTIGASEATPDQSAAVRTTNDIAERLDRGGGLIWQSRSKPIVTYLAVRVEMIQKSQLQFRGKRTKIAILISGTICPAQYYQRLKL